MMSVRTAVVGGCTIVGAAIAIATSTLPAAQEQAALFPLLPPEEETWLALSAAPAPVRDEAGIHLLQRGGFRLSRPSRNGFHCMVIRFGDPRRSVGYSPVCFDAEGARTRLPMSLRLQELREDGLPEDSAVAVVDREARQGRFRAPGPGIAYMLSPHFETVSVPDGRVTQVYPPHLMFYAPGRTNADIGTPDHLAGTVRLPWVLGSGMSADVIVSPFGVDTTRWREHPPHG